MKTKLGTIAGVAGGVNPAANAGTTPPDPDPYVIVDFLFDRGLLSVSIKNIGSRPAFAVRVAFSHKLMGAEGTVDVSALPLFQALEFLPGGKEISTFLDTSASYFRSGQPDRITTHIICQDAQRRTITHTINHDLAIYRQIGYINGAFPEV